MALVLRSNKFYGGIPQKFCHFNSLQIIDLAHNKLSGLILQCFGIIHQTMASLTFLSHLNLSYNNFSSKISSSTQIQSFSAMNFIGNHDLCGPPLTPSCVGDDTTLEPSPNADDEGGEDGGWIDMK
ncbi:hypothetical protein FH972_019776 [Carpinus fangiana]|uniref:Leucine-rich repeat-containing N-terminal plant-type domain-containing protein n=1 Tax=Carpinus fangiana TaxID=176857 RepID=A0A5N6RSP8_9ROSI|nr:hypothetical protein FH972_019776 [Carpinus fangiana]